MPDTLTVRGIVRLAFAERLRDYRDAHSWEPTQNTLDKRCGLPAGTIAQWESGKRCPNLASFLCLCVALDEPPETFITDELLNKLTEIRHDK